MVEPELVRRYVDAGQVKLVWRDFAWIGQESRQAAQAARCAGRQGRFWEYHDHLYRNQRGENRGQFSPPNLKAFAGALRLDAAPFGACLDAGGDAAAVQQDFAAGRARGVNATPYFFVNGRPLVGAAPAAQFVSLIEAELARVGSATPGVPSAPGGGG